MADDSLMNKKGSFNPTPSKSTNYQNVIKTRGKLKPDIGIERGTKKMTERAI